MRFRPIRYGWGRGARRYIAINRGNIDSPRSCAAACALSKNRKSAYAPWQLALLYGFAGFGYIIVATYLPLMAKSAGSPLLTAHLWSLVGGDHSRLLRLAVGSKTLGRPAMPDREPVDPERLRAAVSRQRLVVAVNTEQYWFWRHVYGHNLAGDAACPTTQRAGQY